MGKRLTSEETLVIQAHLRKYDNQKKTSLKFKRSLGTINRIYHAMKELDSLDYEQIKDEKQREDLLFLKQIDETNHEHTRTLKETIIDVMQDDWMVDIIKAYKKVLVSEEATKVSVAKNGITPFVQGIEMISRQNVNIASHQIKKLEYQIKLAQLEIQKEELKLRSKAIDLVKETYKPENDNFKKAAAEALELLMNDKGFDFSQFIEKDSMIVPEDMQHVQ